MKNRLFVCSHGDFAQACMSAAGMIMGEMEGIEAFSLHAGESPEQFAASIVKALETSEEPVLALVDLFGGTPCNVCAALSRKYDMRVVTGLNLGMFIEVAIQKEQVERDALATLALDTLVASGKVI